ncbi:MAG: methyltransferase domain-containing protein [Acidobacteriota bacterium]|nr:MAG: methyltransferase domain-containing protein [Acidobacteriota bacterium]
MDRRLVERWREALLLPGEGDLVSSGVGELAAYFGLDREETERTCLSSLADSKREWESSPRRTPGQIIDFYRRTRSYLFEHVWWHATDEEENASNVAILDYARRSGAKSCLDFGSGVGANAILFARAGFEVTLADVSTTMLEFAGWRLARRGLEARLVDLNQSSLPEGEFEFVTAVDVLEHVADPGATLRRIARSMRHGGRLVFNYRAGVDPERPMHILPHAGHVLGNLRRAGFRDISSSEPDLARMGYMIVERHDPRGILDHSMGWCDRLRYSSILLGERAPAPRHPQAVFLDRLIEATRDRPRWLDVGCGRSVVPPWLKGAEEAEAALIRRSGLLAGADPDFGALRENRSCALRVCFDGQRLPFADSSFDLVTSNMVFEHVERPEVLLREIRRVLGRGGRMLALTPNWLDFVTIGSRLIPDRLQRQLVSRIEGRAEAEIYPTRFRFNRPAVIARMLGDCGFTQCRIENLEHPDIYSGVPLLARLESTWHRLAGRYPALRGVLMLEAE